jgi:hypothetical protein
MDDAGGGVVRPDQLGGVQRTHEADLQAERVRLRAERIRERARAAQHEPRGGGPHEREALEQQVPAFLDLERSHAHEQGAVAELVARAKGLSCPEVRAKEVAVHPIRDDAIGCATHERRFSKRGPREPVGEEHRQPDPRERQTREWIARRPGRRDAVHDAERAPERRDGREPDVSRAVHQHDVDRELPQRAAQRSRAAPSGVAHRERLDGELARAESGGERLVGDKRDAGVAPRVQPAREHGEHATRAPPEAARRQERDAERVRR